MKRRHLLLWMALATAEARAWCRRLPSAKTEKSATQAAKATALTATPLVR